jgi:hypothetical protein
MLRFLIKVREELIKSIENTEASLRGCAKLMDLLREYDPEGFDDMRRLYQEIEGRPMLSEVEIDALIEEDSTWPEKKRATSKRIKALFDDAMEMEARRKRLRFERAASVMVSMYVCTLKSVRCIYRFDDPNFSTLLFLVGNAPGDDKT